MVLGRYDTKLLEFIYMLTKKQKHMNSLEIAKYISSRDRMVTDRTVRRWFSYLRKYHFDYFPYPRYYAMGLVPVWVLMRFNERFMEILPYKAAVVYGINFQNFEKCLLNLYLIPASHIKEFKSLCSMGARDGVVKKCHTFSSAVAYYSPFHRIFSKDGLVEFPEDHVIDNSYFSSILKHSLNSNSSNELREEITENPFIIPVILEYFREHRSSHQVWNSFRRKLGDKAWEYVKDSRIRRERKGGAGIRLVQRTMKELHDNFHEFFHQIRVVYYPFYSHENNILYLMLKLKRRSDIVPLSELLSKHAVSIVTYPPLNHKSKEIMYYVLTNKKQTMNIISNLIQPYIDKSYNNMIIYEDFNASLKYRGPKSRHWRKYYLRSNYHRLFDPETAKWKFSTKRYEKDIRKLKSGMARS